MGEILKAFTTQQPVCAPSPSAIDTYPIISFDRFRWLHRSGVPIRVLVDIAPWRYATGRRAPDGIFEPGDDGTDFIVLAEAADLVFWSPRTGEIATAANRAFALGEDAIDAAATYALGESLNIFADPLDWLRAGCSGCVVIDWRQAFDRLRHCPKVAVAEPVLPLYTKYMRPPHSPAVSVIISDRRAAA